MTRAHDIVDKLLENEDMDYVKNELERLEPLHCVRVSFSKIKFDDDGSGNYEDEHGWVDEFGVDMEPDEFEEEDGVDAVLKTIRYLQNEGATGASSYPFTIDTWYETQSERQNDGWYYEQHYHLSGFSEEEQARVYRVIVRPAR
jgi:hypothetical protein